jgi:hypothetical protein
VFVGPATDNAVKAAGTDERGMASSVLRWRQSELMIGRYSLLDSVYRMFGSLLLGLF